MTEAIKYVFNQTKFFETTGYTPHAGQQKFHDSTARFRCMTCGRRWGKSLSASREAMKALVKKPDQLGWIVAPTYDLAEKVFRELYWGFHRKLPYLIKNSSMSKGNMFLELQNGSKVICKSADNPVSLIGEGLNFLIIDEASKIKSDVWWEALRPTIADKKGWAVFISTPTGKNWFYELYVLGIDHAKNPQYESWSFTSYDNPHVDKSEIDEARTKTPKDKFRQEWLAEFLESADSYFSYDLIQSCIDEDIKIIEKREHPKHAYYAGVDCARMGEDESVIMVLERNIFTGELKIVYIEVWETNTTIQLSGRVRFLDSQFRFEKVFIDMAGLGSGVYDELNTGIPGRLHGCKFTNKEKQDIFSNLKVLMEAGRLKYPKNRKLMEQMRDLRYVTTPSGDIKIHHSEYGYDDYCFVAGTKVLTDKGQVSIEKLRVGDLVMTRCGFKPIINVGSRVSNVISRFGLTGTPDHPFITTNGIVKFINVNVSHILYIWNEKQSIITEKNITDIQSLKDYILEDTIGHIHQTQNVQKQYTDKYGKTHMVKFQKVMSYITKTKIHLTIILKIWKACQEENTNQNIAKQKKENNKQENILKKQDKKLSTGINQKTALNGIKNTIKNHWRLLKNTFIHAKNVKKILNQQEEIKLGIVKYAGKDAITEIGVIKRRVYNISVRDHNEYFANNILVHNCDSLALACMGIKQTFNYKPVLA